MAESSIPQAESEKERIAGTDDQHQGNQEVEPDKPYSFVRLPEPYLTPRGFDDMADLEQYVSEQRLWYLLRPKSLDFDEELTVASIISKADGAVLERDAVLAIDAFVESLDYGVFPPFKVLVFFYAAFREYLEEGGSRRLDEILRLAHSQRSKDGGFRRNTAKRVNDHDCMRVHILTTEFGFSIKEAANMVIVQYNQLGIAPPDLSMLEKLYRAYPPRENPNMLQKAIAGFKWHLPLSTKLKLEFLQAFPEERIVLGKTRKKLASLKRELHLAVRNAKNAE